MTLFSPPFFKSGVVDSLFVGRTGLDLFEDGAWVIWRTVALCHPIMSHWQSDILTIVTFKGMEHQGFKETGDYLSWLSSFHNPVFSYILHSLIFEETHIVPWHHTVFLNNKINSNKLNDWHMLLLLWYHVLNWGETVARHMAWMTRLVLNTHKWLSSRLLMQMLRLLWKHIWNWTNSTSSKSRFVA